MPKPPSAARSPRRSWLSKITPEIIARARNRKRHANDVTAAFDPFKAPDHPPRVLPKNAAGIAQDQNITETFGWASNTIVSAYAEGQVWLGYAELALLAQRAEYRVISECIAEEMTREWIELKSTGEDDKTDKIKKLNDALDHFKVRQVFRKAIEQDGFFGRSHIYIDTGDTDDREELKTSIGNGHDDTTKEKIKKGALKALRNVEPWTTYPTRYDSNDPLSGNWYKPDSWFVMGKEIHRTRLLTLIGREVPDLLKPAYSFGGLSMSQMVKPYVENWLKTRQAVADLIKSFSIFAIWTDMGVNLGVGGEDVFRRADLFTSLRDNHDLMMLNKSGAVEEDFKNVSAPLGTLDALQAQSQEHMCAAARTPVVKLLGIQPAGLNASSQGELDTWEDFVGGRQESMIREPLTTIVDFIQMSEFGKIDPEITIHFKPLEQLDPLQKAQIELIKAQTDTANEMMGAISGEEVRKRLAGDEHSPYQGLDLEKPLPEPDPGMPPDINQAGGVKAPQTGGAKAPQAPSIQSPNAPKRPQLPKAA